MKRKIFHITPYLLLLAMAFLFLHSELGLDHHEEDEDIHHHHDYCQLVFSAHVSLEEQSSVPERKLQKDITPLPLPENETTGTLISGDPREVLLTDITQKQSPPVYIMNRILLI